MNNLKLIHHKDYLLLVDTDTKVDLSWESYLWDSRESFGDAEDVYFAPAYPNSARENIPYMKKIVAHLSLNGAPLLEGVMLMVDLPTQIDYSWITEVEKVTGLKYDTESQFDRGVEVGYKIAAASKQYTEDDIDAAFLAGSNHQSEVDALRFQAEDYNTALTRFKDSLSPAPVLPVDYALHTQACCDYICNGSCEKYGSTIVPITIPNEQGVEVLQGKWIY